MVSDYEIDHSDIQLFDKFDHDWNVQLTQRSELAATNQHDIQQYVDRAAVVHYKLLELLNDFVNNRHFQLT